MLSSPAHSLHHSFEAICCRLHGRNDAYVLLDGVADGASEFILTCYEMSLELYPITQPAPGSPPRDILSMPHLIRPDPENFVLEYCRSLLGKNAFVFVWGDEDILATLSLLARMLWVKVPPEGELMWFRFYAPNILTTFLSQATEQHLATAFAGNLKGYWAEHIPDARQNSGQQAYAKPVADMAFFPSPYDAPLPAQREWMRLDPTHLDIFEEDRARHIAVGLCRHIARQKSMTDESWPLMRRHVEEAIDQAAEYGIGSYSCLCLYVDAALQFGWDFALTHCTLKEIVPRTGIPDTLKEEVLRSVLVSNAFTNQERME